ncbi:MAG: LuxR C-terminal-related transcriptional regulator [Spirochaetia bacterium]|jgi:DNA-binding CsgD family transcriptional regulator/heme/copper-type cytochrome/quinol oxidase subunit 4|nr:LuxR C-terminal-related transcriptional regulator [Spirochaetia bacterium]
MERLIDTVQKRIGLLISLVGLTVVTSNFSKRLLFGDFFHAVSGFTVWSVFLFTVPFIISVFLENGFLKKIQIFAFLATGTLNIIDAFQQFYGPGLFLAAWLLMRHYGYLEKHAKIKNIAILSLITALSQLSAYLHRTDDEYASVGLYAGFTTLMYTFFLVSLLVILWRDMSRQQELLRQENFSLQMDYNKLSAQLAELEESKKPFDLKALGITPAEERVIKILTIYKAGNREIAERLNLAESTVKLHIYNICNKIGVDNRFAIIDLCKYNFS